MKLRVTCDLSFQVDEASALILMLRPYRGAGQTLTQETYTITPFLKMIEHHDDYGNGCQRLLVPKGYFFIHTVAEVIVDHQVNIVWGAPFVEIQYLPERVLHYLAPSRYCESDRFNELATRIVGDALPGYDQVVRIVNWIQQYIEYVPGSSDVPLSAVEINEQGYGVCRDLAHLGIALCRSISLPARIVVGYLHNLVPMDLHAWFEVYVGHQWYSFDPTQSSVIGGRVIIAFGRDAADVSIFHQFGSGCLLTDMKVQVQYLDEKIKY